MPIRFYQLATSSGTVWEVVHPVTRVVWVERTYLSFMLRCNTIRRSVG